MSNKGAHVGLDPVRTQVSLILLGVLAGVAIAALIVFGADFHGVRNVGVTFGVAACIGGFIGSWLGER